MISELSGQEVVQNQGRGRKVLIILAVIFLLPFSVAAILHLLEIRPGGKSYGDLIEPPHVLQIPELHEGQDKAFAATAWSKKWNLVVISKGGCDDACQAELHMLNQVHISLGKEADRVQRILLVSEEAQDGTLTSLQNKYPDLIILAGKDEATTKFAKEFERFGQAGSFYLVDPLGNLMMQYPQSFEPKGLHKDLVRLLKSSWAG